MWKYSARRVPGIPLQVAVDVLAREWEKELVDLMR
jgi:hypothetical protein